MVVNEKISLEKVFKDKRVRLSVRLNYVIFPIDGFKLFEVLRKAGYTPLRPSPHRPLARGASLGFGGPIARKGENIVDGNTDRGFLGVEGTSFQSAIRGFDELNKLIKENFGIDLNDGARFYEIIAQFTLDTNKNAIKAIGQVFEESDFVRDVNSILGEETSIFSIRLRPKNKVPNQEEWLDITIEPDLIKPESTYTIFVVYRSTKRTKVEAFGKGLEPKILALIKRIEEETL